jgi:uncharacterized membrane protein
MNDAHFHLIVNHLPIIVPMVGIFVLLIGFILNQEIIKRVSYAIFIIGAIATFPAMNSGEGAEEIVEHLPGMSHDLIHEHEEKAEFFAILSYLLGVVSLISLWVSWKRKKFATMVSALVLVFSVVVLFFGRQAGTSGGEISHPEIREGFKAAAYDDHNEKGEVDEEHDED